MTRSAIAVLTVLLFAVPSLAQTTWYVDVANCPGPGDGSIGNPFCSIQDAIDAATSGVGDEVVVAQGTYLEAINFNGKAITVRSTDPDDPLLVMQTVIDGNGALHVVQCVNGEGPDTVLSGFVITGGNANGAYPDNVGGGMYNFSSSPTVNNCSFSGNSADFGGGMFNDDASSPTVTNCSFIANSATSFSGGGMFNILSSSPTLTNCAFSGNTAASNGGGMYNQGSSPTVTNCEFSGNSAFNSGGGMYNNGGSPAVTNTSFSVNTAAVGGGMYNTSSNPTVTNSGFCFNTPDAINGGYTNGGGNSLVHCAPPIPLPDPCPSDTNNDGVVDVLDLLNLLGSWGVCPG